MQYIDITYLNNISSSKLSWIGAHQKRRYANISRFYFVHSNAKWSIICPEHCDRQPMAEFWVDFHEFCVFQKLKKKKTDLKKK